MIAVAESGLKLGLNRKLNILNDLYFFVEHELFWRSIQNYSPHVFLYMERSQYIVKTAENGNELEEILKLRHNIFYEELLNKQILNRIDMDDYDMNFDHLCVIDKTTQKIVGTYRLNSSLFNDEYYSENQFNIKSIINLPGRKLELGRACIHKDYRKACVLGLLCKGLWEYIRLTFSRYVFGCSSIMTTNRNKAAAVYNYLRKFHPTENQYDVIPEKSYRIPDFKEYVGYSPAIVEDNHLEFKKLIPPLLQLYIKSGAIVCGEPALDKRMKCIDFFTFLDVNNINPKMMQLVSR
ncbi:MAG: hypothetical protein ACD_79C00047G0002 [uncultured bacterium]|nr:MAG: hypothetical protein ACD_79C00047G0002 [uncultured bacterium]